MTRPFGAIMLFAGKLYFSTSTRKEVFKQMKETPDVCICAMGKDREWIRITGIAKLDKSTIARQKMLDTNPALLERKRFTSANDPTFAVFYIDEMEVEIHD